MRSADRSAGRRAWRTPSPPWRIAARAGGRRSRRSSATVAALAAARRTPISAGGVLPYARRHH